MKRIAFKTHYDNSETVCGYVVPFKHDKYGYYITEAQYKSALKKRTVGGCAGLDFLTDEAVFVTTNDKQHIIG